MYQWHQSCHMLSHGTTLSLECLEWTCRTEPRSKPRMCCWLVVRWVWLKLQLRCAEIRTFDSSNYWCLYVQTPSGFQTWQCKKDYHRAMTVARLWSSHSQTDQFESDGTTLAHTLLRVPKCVESKTLWMAFLNSQVSTGSIGTYLLGMESQSP